ncbi:MAG: hypothetical protein IT532_14470 [Burkholderiales bacterium]|nr:hypothetical protein [Burkholderiales bacterium]
MLRFLAHFLLILAAWTVVIKYLFPVGYAVWQGEPPLTHVYLDFWPVVHVWLGWSLLDWQRHTYAFALIVSVAEIVIVVSKFVLFLADPEWTIWRTNWFVNKVFVLGCFTLLLGYLLTHAAALRRRGAPATTGV